MTSFRVDDMTCGHCTATITKALRALDPTASVRVDLARRQVDIDASTADATGLRTAIANPGYPAVLLDAAVADADQPARLKSGCCCG